MNAKPFVLAHPADHYACGRYRVIWPLQTLIDAGRCDGVASDYLLDDVTLADLRPDVVVFQRVLELDQLAAVKRYRRILPDAQLIFELDDLITDIPHDNRYSKLFYRQTRDRLQQGIGLCDRLVVSTPALAVAYGSYAREVFISRNTLYGDFWLVGRRHVSHSRPRVGWAGSSGHLGDLKFMIPVIRATSSVIDWIFLGPVPEAFRKYAKEIHPLVSIDDYPAKLASLDLDLAVAPLAVHPYNDAKSCLRLLELGACGYPVLCSDGVGAFDVPLPVTRVENRADAWIDAVVSAVADLVALARRGDELRQVIRDQWIMDRCSADLAAAWGVSCQNFPSDE